MATAIRNKVVSHAAWIKARQALLAKEKKFTRERAKMSAAQRALPWEEVEKQYAFKGPDGLQTLADLFDGRSQLVVYHFMFAPRTTPAARIALVGRQLRRSHEHLSHHDVTMIAISRPTKLAAYRKRMGWSFKWMSSFGGDFATTSTSRSRRGGEEEEGLLQLPRGRPVRPGPRGHERFLQGRQGRVYRTYSAFARGIDIFNLDYNYIDVLKGRDEAKGNQHWIRRHDEYGR